MRAPGVVVVVALLVAGAADAQDGPPTQTVVAGERYRAGALRRLVTGSEYRQLWTAPVEVEVLDLQTFAGGLTPTTRGGGQQTQSLRFKGKDGRRFGFRSVDKDPAAILPEELRQTFVASFVRDQTSSSHPASAVVAAVLLEAAGVLHSEPRLVVLPDDEILGEFRKEFAGMLGMFEEYPLPGPGGTPGYAGATQILDQPEMWKRLAAGPGDRIDTRAFLKARLMDLFMGDWDRHRGQWRWARLGSDPIWQPFPEDRDQAFVRYDGLGLAWARFTYPQLLDFGEEYGRLVGAAWNGRDLDRRFLAELEKPVWVETAAALRASLTDASIDAAVARLPEAYRRLDGARLAATLKRRRDQIPDVAERWYHFLAGDVDVRGTDAAEHADVEHLADGGLDVSVSALGADGKPTSPPYFRRRFHPRETREVRLYLEGGDDSVAVRGRPGSIAVRVIGGDGGDTIDDSAGGGTRVYDSVGTNRVFRGGGTSVDTRPYSPPAPVDMPPRDWGRQVVPLLWFSGSPDIGAFLGGGLATESYGFRRHPFASRHSLQAGYATAAGTYRAEYRGDVRRTNSRVRMTVGARASGIEILRFHGFGNETEVLGTSDFHKVKQEQLTIEPAVAFPLGARAFLTLGPSLSYAATDLPGGRLIDIARPYGADPDGFGQVGVTSTLVWSSTDRAETARRGARLSLEGRLRPRAWDVEETFGATQGEASAFVAAGLPLKPTLAVRVGGKRVFGRYPFHEAAYIGGATVRGLGEQRYAGDGSAYANAELRWSLGRFFVIFPGEAGLFGLADTGRVFLDGESSDRWHAGFGGGVWVALLERRNTVSVAVAGSEGRMGVYVRAGLLF
jgi:hypothetical protein